MVSAASGHSPSCGGWVGPGQGWGCSGAWGRLPSAGSLGKQAGCVHRPASEPGLHSAVGRRPEGGQGRGCVADRVRAWWLPFQTRAPGWPVWPLHPVPEMPWAGRVFGVAALGVGVERAQGWATCLQALPSPVPGEAAVGASRGHGPLAELLALPPWSPAFCVHPRKPLAWGRLGEWAARWGRTSDEGASGCAGHYRQVQLHPALGAESHGQPGRGAPVGGTARGARRPALTSAPTAQTGRLSLARIAEGRGRGGFCSPLAFLVSRPALSWSLVVSGTVTHSGRHRHRPEPASRVFRAPKATPD